MSDGEKPEYGLRDKDTKPVPSWESGVGSQQQEQAAPTAGSDSVQARHGVGKDQSPGLVVSRGGACLLPLPVDAEDELNRPGLSGGFVV
jgi:hypothetical protein